jgi:hypothetical protein
MVKHLLLVLTADQSACCRLLANRWGGKWCLTRYNVFFSLNNVTPDFQHSYREGHSTRTVLTQITDDWLKEIDGKKIVGAVLLDRSAAFDVIDHNRLVEKMYMLWLYIFYHIMA